MKSNYNQLGQYIEMVSRTNSDLKYGIEDVRGCSNTKQMMQTRANLIGRTYEKFIVLKPQEFVFNRRTTRNGEKIGMAYNNTDRDYIFTNDYVAFRVKQGYLDKLLPDYLYLFFCRDEFDRYARYKSTGSATEFFNWEDMCAVPFKIPPMDFQQLIVNTYKVLNERIALKQKINDNLEAMLAAVFADTFSADNAAERSKLSELMSFGNGKSRPKTDGTIPVYGGNGILSYTDQHNIENAILIGRVGAYCGSVYLEQGICWVSDNAIYAKSKISKDEFFDYFLLKGLNLFNHHVGTGQQLLTQEILNNIEVAKPDIEQIAAFNENAKAVYETIAKNENEIIRLQELSSLLLSRLAG